MTAANVPVREIASAIAIALDDETPCERPLAIAGIRERF